MYPGVVRLKWHGQTNLQCRTKCTITIAGLWDRGVSCTSGVRVCNWTDGVDCRHGACVVLGWCPRGDSFASGLGRGAGIFDGACSLSRSCRSDPSDGGRTAPRSSPRWRAPPPQSADTWAARPIADGTRLPPGARRMVSASLASSPLPDARAAASLKPKYPFTLLIYPALSRQIMGQVAREVPVPTLH